MVPTTAQQMFAKGNDQFICDVHELGEEAGQNPKVLQSG